MKDAALKIIGEVSGRDPAEITPEMDLVNDLGIDSPKALRLLIRLEDDLELEISDEHAGRMRSVGDVLEFLSARA